MSRQLLEIRAVRPAIPGLGSAWTIASGSRELARGKRGMFARCPLRWSAGTAGTLELRRGQMGPAVHRADGTRAAFAEGISGSGGHRLSGAIEEPPLAFEMRWSEERIEIQSKGVRIIDIRKAPPDPRAPKNPPTIHRASIDGADLPESTAILLLILATPFLRNLT
jgi:hypothetical protein